MRLALTLTLALVLPVWAQDAPEIRRAPATPQVPGAVHGVRTIPEACARLEGVFTGDPAAPYRLTAVRTSPRCQPRARLVDAAQAVPSPVHGWILNDEIRVPNADCSRQQAIVRIWRKPGTAVPPTLDAQGRARIYLSDVPRQSAAASEVSLPSFAATLQLRGTCE